MTDRNENEIDFRAEYFALLFLSDNLSDILSAFPENERSYERHMIEIQRDETIRRMEEIKKEHPEEWPNIWKEEE